MSNPGNSGQRYKQTTLLSLEAKGNKVLHILSCGHDYEVVYDTPEHAERIVGLMQDRIGKRQRCNRCK